MKKFLKWSGIVLIMLIAIMMIYSIIGKDEVLDLRIKAVDLAPIPDGTYVGSYDNYRWTNKVEVSVSEHKITGIKPLKIQQGRDGLVKELILKILDRQSPDVDAITGATASSNGFLKAVETALESASKRSP